MALWMNKQNIQNSTLASSGLLGVNVIAIVQLTSVTSLSLFLLIAVFCFSISIPFLAAVVYILFRVAHHTKYRVDRYLAILLPSGILLSLAGLASLFFHFNIIAGSLFVAATIAASWIGVNQKIEAEQSNE